MSVARIPRRLLRDSAYDVLQEAIVSGRLAPGTVLRDQELANSTGLSRTPVREALARLTDEGLVESKPHAYTRVTPLLRRDCEEAYSVLRVLHDLAIRLAVPNLEDQHLARMRAANADFAVAITAGDVEATLAADDDFHGVYLEASANSALLSSLDRLHPRIRRLERMRFSSTVGRTSIETHEQIVRACERRDADAAAARVAENWATLATLIDLAFAD